jgi:hypothetical protein
MSRVRSSVVAVAALLVGLVGGVVVLPGAAAAAETRLGEGYELALQLLSDRAKERRRAARALIAAGDPSIVPALVDVLFFTPRHNRPQVVDALETLTGEELSDRYLEWVELVGRRAELTPPDGYVDFKAELFSRIDPRYRQVFFSGAPARIRLEEIVSGGVPLDGIPSVDDPAVVPAAEAGYLRDGEQVFGVSLGGEQRAYPLRVLSWHEMLNDTVGGVPVTLSFCTLCGSGILYHRAPGDAPYTFGTSGLLYRSNKLMFDRQTFSLWSNLTGEPVVGRLAASPVELEMLPMTLTTWEAWRRLHPETTVLAIEPLRELYPFFDYQPGAADRARRGVTFPVWQKSDRLERDAEIYALEVAGAAKAYPLDRVLAEGLVHDELGGVALLLVGDLDSGAVRAYRRGARTFRRGETPGELVDADGGRWRLGEAALIPLVGGEALPRQPGHVALWFGWYGFYPQTDIYDGGGG